MADKRCLCWFKGNSRAPEHSLSLIFFLDFRLFWGCLKLIFINRKDLDTHIHTKLWKVLFGGICGIISFSYGLFVQVTGS